MALAREGWQTRAMLLDTALEASGRVGLGKLSMGEVARAAGSPARPSTGTSGIGTS